MTQPDLHPDADALNAFAERTLPDAERARVLAHMADCGRCREIVYLARTAAEPELAPAAAAVQPEPRQSWFSAAFTKWRVALIPAAALATVGAVVIWVQLRHATQPMEMARLAQPSAPVTPPAKQHSSSSALTIGPPSMSAPAPPASPSGGVAKKAAPPAAEMIELPASSIVAPAQQQRATHSIHLDANSAAMARYPSQPQTTSPSAASTLTASRAAIPDQMDQRLDDRAALANKPSSAGTARFGAPVRAPAPASPNMAAVHGTLSAPPADGPAQLAVQSSNPDLPPPPSNGFALMRLTRKAKLPSGLDSVSSAALLNRLVAIDSAGSVFSSQDGGQHWEAVKAQWTGKAVTVHSPPQPVHPLLSVATSEHTKSTPALAEPPPAANPEENPSPASPAPLPAAAGVNAAAAAPGTPNATAKSKPPEMLFKLVTDRHEVWLSADGKAWRLQ